MTLLRRCFYSSNEIVEIKSSSPTVPVAPFLSSSLIQIKHDSKKTYVFLQVSLPRIPRAEKVTRHMFEKIGELVEIDIRKKAKDFSIFTDT